jgi:hypothetical protein
MGDTMNPMIRLEEQTSEEYILMGKMFGGNTLEKFMLKLLDKRKELVYNIHKK